MLGKSPGVIKECRATARVSLVVAVTCQDNTAVYFGKSKNISEGGMMIKSPRMLPLDSMITVRFLLPVYRKVIAVKAKATPVWIRFGYSMGIRFVSLKEEYREAIAKFVEQVLAQPLS